MLRRGPVAGGAGLIRLEHGTLATASALDIVLTQYAPLGFAGFKIKLRNFIPASDASLWCRFSGDGGASYDAGASDYRYANTASYSTGNDDWSGIRSDAAAQMVLGENITSNAVGGFTGEVDIDDCFNVPTQARASWRGIQTSGAFAAVHFHGGGMRVSGGAKNAVRFLMSTGNIASGKWALYGYV